MNVADLTDGQVRNVRRMRGENFMVEETIWSGIAVGPPFGFEDHGRALSFRLLHILELADDGQITRENASLDSAANAGRVPQN